MMRRYVIWIVLLLLLGMRMAYAGPAAVATVSPSATTASELPLAAPIAGASDPYEKFNRAMFNFNDHLDRWILKPIATLYNKILPTPLNKGIHNVFNNIQTVPTIVNDVLQFNFYQATNDMWRLGINSTIGIGGLFDVATRIHLPAYQNDFGLTLAHWGYKQSNYLVLPFWGPSTPRDGIGMPIDYYAFSVYPWIQPRAVQYGVYALSVVDARAQLLRYQNVMDAAAFDKYVFVRNAYMQRRAFQVQQTFQRDYADQNSH